MQSRPTVTVWDLRVGERLALEGPGRATITMVRKSGQIARLRVVAPEDVQIRREANDERDLRVPSMAP